MEKEFLERRLRQADRLLEQFSNSVRGPLYTMIELSRMAQKEGLPREHIADYLKVIEKSGHAMNESIDDINVLRQIYMDDVHIHPERIYIYDLFNRLKVDTQRILDGNGSYSSTDIDMMDIAVLADYNAIFHLTRKLVMDLTGFSMQKNPISCKVNRLDETEDVITLRLEMAYENFPFTSSQREWLLMPFETLNSTVEKGIQSINQRILIIRYLMHAMGSDIMTAEEREDGCKVLYTDIPFPIVDRKKRCSIDPEKVDFTGKRILVADDDNVNLKIIEKLLREKNADFITVRDGKEALYTFRNEHGRFDLILMDIIMPDLSGIEVARQIRKTTTIPESKNVPIIAMTVNALHEYYYESKEAGMNAYLVKPVESDRLYTTIAEYLN